MCQEVKQVAISPDYLHSSEVKMKPENNLAFTHGMQDGKFDAEKQRTNRAWLNREWTKKPEVDVYDLFYHLGYVAGVAETKTAKQVIAVM